MTFRASFGDGSEQTIEAESMEDALNELSEGDDLLSLEALDAEGKSMGGISRVIPENN